MAYRNVSNYEDASWQQRDPSFAMECYSQNYRPYDMSAWDRSYPVNQMGMMAYAYAQFRYEREHYRRNQMLSHMALLKGTRRGKRLSKESPATVPPSKRKQSSEKTRSGNNPQARKKLMQGKRNTQADLESQPPLKKKATNEKRLSQSESLSKQLEVTETKSKRRNKQRGRFYRYRRNFRRQAKGENTNAAEEDKNAKCRLCSERFSNVQEHRDHLKSESHKVKSAEFHYLRKLQLGFDKDQAALEPMKTREQNDGDSVESKQDGEPNAVGVLAVVKIQGFYCKLCRKFFKDENVAKEKHCLSATHYEEYKKAMAVALKDEEERQAMEVQAGAETQKSENLAALEREAIDVVTDVVPETAELAKKEKDDGTGVSHSDIQKISAEVKQDVKEDGSLLEEKEEQTEGNTMDEPSNKNTEGQNNCTLLDDEKIETTPSENKEQIEVKSVILNDGASLGTQDQTNT